MSESLLTSLACADCGTVWNDASEPRYRATLSDDGAGAIFFCAACMERRRGGSLALYPLQLEFADGRWTVDELRLPAPPRLGDVLRLAGDIVWQVTGTRSVPVRPAGKPPREYVVCRPLAA